MTDRKKNNLTNLKKIDFAFSQQIFLRFFIFFSLIFRSKMLHENTFTFSIDTGRDWEKTVRQWKHLGEFFSQG